MKIPFYGFKNPDSNQIILSEIESRHCIKVLRHKIGDRVQMQAKSGVLKNIDDDSVIMGYPAISYRDYNKSYVHFKNLPKIMNFINKLMKKSNEQ